MSSFQQTLRALQRGVVRTVAGGVVVVGTVEVTTHLPSQGRSSDFYRSLTDDWGTPLLRRFLAPEMAHHLAIAALAVEPATLRPTPIYRPSAQEQQLKMEQTVFGSLVFPNPIGLAAGMDKDGQAIAGLLDLGFGSVEIGSVTPLPQPGNEQPRMFRLVEDQGIINRYGFNSQGMMVVQERLRKIQETRRNPVPIETSVEPPSLWQNLMTKLQQLQPRQSVSFLPPIGVNLGKNKTAEDPLEGYQSLIASLGPYADYLVINVSSPNTPGLRDLQQTDSLEYLVKGSLEARNALHQIDPSMPLPPLLVKLSPDLSNAELQEIATVLMNCGIDGIIVSNTTIQRPNGLQSSNRHESGGLSGRPLALRSTECIRILFAATKGRLPIIGVGGIFTAHDVYEKLRAGASLVQIYSGMIYQGPGVVTKIRRDLAQILKENGHSGVEEVVGLDHEVLYWQRRQEKRRKELQELDENEPTWTDSPLPGDR